jgi:cell wall-associated NlpC family hydrolase
MIFNNEIILSRDAVIKEAYTWEHVPYVDGQHSKFGCDCVGFLIGVAKALDYIDRLWKPEYYSPQWHLHGNDEKLLKTLEDIGCKNKPLEDRIPGDIITFQFYSVSAHAGFFMPDDAVIHSLIDRGVVLHGLRGKWKMEWLKGCWHIPGISDAY